MDLFGNISDENVPFIPEKVIGILPDNMYLKKTSQRNQEEKDPENEGRKCNRLPVNSHILCV